VRATLFWAAAALFVVVAWAQGFAFLYMVGRVNTALPPGSTIQSVGGRGPFARLAMMREVYAHHRRLYPVSALNYHRYLFWLLAILGVAAVAVALLPG